MKTYYLCDLASKRVLSGGALPEVYGNINCLEGLTPDLLADLGWAGNPQFGFLSYNDAIANGMDLTSLNEAKKTVTSMAWDGIEDERERRKSGGFKVGNLWFHSDERSRSQYITYLGVILEMGLPPETVVRKGWKTMSGELVDMTVQLVRDIRNSGISTENALFDVGVAHRTAMEASDDPLGYDFSKGWPLTYLESLAL